MENQYLEERHPSVLAKLIITLIAALSVSLVIILFQAGIDPNLTTLAYCLALPLVVMFVLFVLME